MAMPKNGFQIQRLVSGIWTTILTTKSADGVPPRCVVLRAAIDFAASHPAITEIRLWDELIEGKPSEYTVSGCWPEIAFKEAE